MKNLIFVLTTFSSLAFAQVKIEKIPELKTTSRVMGIQMIQKAEQFSICYKNVMYKYITDNNCFTFLPNEAQSIKNSIVEGFSTPADMVKLSVNTKHVVVKYEKVFGITYMNFYDIQSGNIAGYSDGITEKQFVKFFDKGIR